VSVGTISPSDVLIVGAGPGGSNAARVALDGGLSVVQIDAQRFPRAKPCAGGITRKAARALALDIRPSLRGTSDTIEFNSWRKRTNRFTACGDRGGVSEDALVSFVSRAEFDADLVRQNGRSARFEFSDGERVEHVEFDGIFRVRTSRRRLAARQLIGADGAYSIVNRAFAVARPRLLATAIEVNVPRSRLSTSTRLVPSVDYGVVEDGYGWIFPKDDHLSIGLYTLAPKARRLRERLVGYMLAKGARPEGDPLDGLQAHRIPVGGFRLRTPDAPVYVVGDAAGLADALTGEGIYHALESGRLAGEAAALVAAGKASHRSYYRHLWRSVLPDTALTYALSTQFHRNADRSLRLLERAVVWRPLTYGYARGATFTACVLRGVSYLARSWTRARCHKAAWEEALADGSSASGA
jgi:geranylgeranyl reductase family protein